MGEKWKHGVVSGLTVALACFGVGYLGSQNIAQTLEQQSSFHRSQLKSQLASQMPLHRAFKVLEEVTSCDEDLETEWKLWAEIPSLALTEYPEAENEDEDIFENVLLNGAPDQTDSEEIFTDGEGGRRLKAKGRASSSSSSSSSSSLGLYTENSYTALRALTREYPWAHIVEPYKTTTLKATHGDCTSSYRWSINGNVQGYGRSIDVSFTSTGYHKVLIEELSAEGETTQVVFNVMCKYVRREIRQLNDADREAFLSGLMIMQRVPTSVGRTLYGEHYVSRDYLTRLHMYYGGAMDCDHWHQGAGFVTSHMALTLQMEKALQTIDPSISAPYWDFTLDSTFYSSETWPDSFLFSDDWFGDASPDNDLHTVVDGRWAFTPMLMDAGKYTILRNAYGLMRAPWNADPTPFVTRSTYVYGYKNNLKPSGCQQYQTTLHKSDWMSLAKVLNSAAHGHIHEIVGGAWNIDFNSKLDGHEEDSVYSFIHEIQALSKILWRAGYVSCVDSCDMTDASSECGCSCDASAMEGMEAYEVLSEAGILAFATFFDKDYNTVSTWTDEEDGTVTDTVPGYTAEESKVLYEGLLDSLCDPGHLGDMFQASSTNDITFWVIHSTIDRAWHYMRLGTRTFDETWDSTHTCYGHNPTNFQPFKGSLMDDDDHSKFYTNIELYNLLSPTNPKLPYIYSDFEWTHCTFLGYSMSNS